MSKVFECSLLQFASARRWRSIVALAAVCWFSGATAGVDVWTPIGPVNAPVSTPVRGLYMDALSSAVLYAGNYKSVDRGANWSPLAISGGQPVAVMAVSPRRSGMVYGRNEAGVAFSSLIYRSNNFGDDWSVIFSVAWLSTAFLLEAPNAAGTLFLLGNQYSISGKFSDLLVVRSDDGGVNWSDASSGLPGYPDATKFVGAAAIDPSNAEVLYASVNNSVYKTVNGGGMWTDSSAGLPQSRVNALEVSPAQSNTIFAGLGDGHSAPSLYGLYRSDDGGATWGPRNPAFVNLAVTALAIDPSSPSNVYAGTGGGGLYRSTDGGTTFRPINNGLTDVDSLSVNVVVVDPADGRNLYVGTNGGAFALTIDRYDSFVPVIEFYNHDLDHYFMASETQADVPALDGGAFAGWARTGQTFKAYPQPTGAAQPVCRFYIPPQHGDSHFYSASTSECAAVLVASTDPGNSAYPNYSGYAHETAASFYVDVPANGSCPLGEAPVYRLWNKRADSNHRYTTDPVIRDAMVAKGYVLEGVVMCSLP